MKMLAGIILGLALAACAPAQEVKHEDASRASTAPVPAPTPGDVAVHIGVAQDGQRVEVALNQRFAVELVGVPTAGYVWAPAQMPSFLTRAGEASGNTTPEQSRPGFTGGNHWEVLMFVATQPGEGELVLEQRRPWENGGPAAGVFRVTIAAH
jgi:inhibitor of cysteine peptidase